MNLGSLSSVVMAFAVVTSGCGSSNYQSLDTLVGREQKSATIVIAPPEQTVFRQIGHEGSRFIDPEFDPFVEGFISSSASAIGFTIGHYAGYAAAAGNTYTATAATAALPLAGLAIVAASAASGAVSKQIKFDNADEAVANHRLVLDAIDFDNYAEQVLEDSVNEFTYLNVDAVVKADDLALVKNLGLMASGEALEELTAELIGARPKSLDELGEDAFYEFDDLIAEIDSDLAVVIAYFPQFSPMFEVLEIHSIISVYDRSSETVDDVLYTNAITFQSEHHAGLHADDTRGELPEFVDAYRDYLTDVRTRNGSISLSAYKRHKLEERVQVYTNNYRKRYVDFDDHDPEGEYWLEDGGRHMVETLRQGLREIVRLAVSDINGACKIDLTQSETLPGTELEMNRCNTLSEGDRVVYRGEGGDLHSVDAKSRYVLLAPI